MVTDNLLFMKDLDSRFGEGGGGREKGRKRRKGRRGKRGVERGRRRKGEGGGRGLTVSGEATHLQT